MIGSNEIVMLSGDAVAFATGTVCEAHNEPKRRQFESTWLTAMPCLIRHCVTNAAAPLRPTETHGASGKSARGVYQPIPLAPAWAQGNFAPIP